MAMLFDIGHSSHPSGERLQRIILRRLSKVEWASTSDLHAAANKHAKGEDMRDALKVLLANRSIVMRVTRPNGRDVTEFKLL